MKLAVLKSALATAVVGLALAAGHTTDADAATKRGPNAVLPPMFVPQAQEPTHKRLPAGKWRHPSYLPKTAEQPERSPAYESAASVISGTAFVPVVLVDFADNLAERTLHTPTAFHNMLFQDGYPYGAGSMRDYYQDQSAGLFDVTGQVSAWLRMPNAYSYYVGSKQGMQLAEPNAFTLVKDAAAAADSTMNFCNGDTDRDGFVDSFFVVHAGADAAETRSSAMLWSIKWALPSPYTTQDVCANGQRVKIKSFTVQPEEYVNGNQSAPGAPARMVAIGIFCHEFGHALGLPDLYDGDYSSTGGVGPWDVMASGSWGFNGAKPWLPTPFSAWSKIKLGWVNAQNITQNKTGVLIPSADAPRTGYFNGVYRLAMGGSATSKEYFLVENRQALGWARDFPTGGLAIWRIDDSVSGNDNDTHRQVQLLAADGVLGYGDAGDLFPGTSVKRAIDGTTNPSTDSYTGTDTGVAIRSIGDAGATTRADLIVSAAAPPASDTTKPVMSAVNHQFELGYKITGTSVPVQFNWSATDNVGVTGYKVEYSSNGINWVPVTGISSTATSMVIPQLPTGVTNRYRVQARDAAGNWSVYAFSIPVTPGVTDDKAFSIASPWARYSNLTDSYGGTYVASSQAASSITYTFTGRDAALIAPKSSNTGRATLLCDGTSHGFVNTNSTTPVSREVLAWCHFSQSGQHTMKLIVEGTSGKPVFGVDAFAHLS